MEHIVRNVKNSDILKALEPTYETETIADIIVEIKQKWSEINVLLNRLESKSK